MKKFFSYPLIEENLTLPWSDPAVVLLLNHSGLAKKTGSSEPRVPRSTGLSVAVKPCYCHQILKQSELSYSEAGVHDSLVLKSFET